VRYCHKFENVFMWSTRYSFRILIKLEFSRHVFQETQMSNFIKIRPVWVELFHADGQTDGWTDGKTDMTKLLIDFLNFSNAPENHICVRRLLLIMGQLLMVGSHLWWWKLNRCLAITVDSLWIRLLTVRPGFIYYYYYYLYLLHSHCEQLVTSLQQ
jgi:hypothetical protein